MGTRVRLGGALLGGLALVIAIYLVVGRDDGADPPPPAAPAPAAPAPPPPASLPADAAASFREFAMVGRSFPPEWLVRTKRVEWTDGGQLWAYAQLPNNARERTATIEAICATLARYVTEASGRAWHGVSVRTEDGTELVTLTEQGATCHYAVAAA